MVSTIPIVNCFFSIIAFEFFNAVHVVSTAGTWIIMPKVESASIRTVVKLRYGWYLNCSKFEVRVLKLSRERRSLELSCLTFTPYTTAYRRHDARELQHGIENGERRYELVVNTIIGMYL